LQPGAWSNVRDWIDQSEAEQVIMKSVERYQVNKHS